VPIGQLSIKWNSVDWSTEYQNRQCRLVSWVSNERVWIGQQSIKIDCADWST